MSSCGICPGERGIVACTLAPWSSDDRFCGQLGTYLDDGCWRWHWPVVAVRFKYRHSVPTGVKVKLQAWKLSVSTLNKEVIIPFTIEVIITFTIRRRRTNQLLYHHSIFFFFFNQTTRNPRNSKLHTRWRHSLVVYPKQSNFTQTSSVTCEHDHIILDRQAV